MRYFKIPLCRNFHWNAEINQGQMTYECRVQRHVSVTTWVKNWGMTTVNYHSSSFIDLSFIWRESPVISCMEVPWVELEDDIEIDEGFRVLRFWFWKRTILQRFSLKSESEVNSVCFCLSVFSKNDCNSEGDKQTHH